MTTNAAVGTKMPANFADRLYRWLESEWKASSTVKLPADGSKNHGGKNTSVEVIKNQAIITLESGVANKGGFTIHIAGVNRSTGQRYVTSKELTKECPSARWFEQQRIRASRYVPDLTQPKLEDREDDVPKQRRRKKERKCMNRRAYDRCKVIWVKLVHCMTPAEIYEMLAA